jgi:hypothetical protein
VQRLSYDQTDFLLIVVGVFPPGTDADQRDQRREHFPIAGDRLLGKAGIGDADRGQDQN